MNLPLRDRPPKILRALRALRGDNPKILRALRGKNPAQSMLVCTRCPSLPTLTA